ncbi:putative CDP-diacylglycerol--glycerol-3-phosphate 3-phosphatidyltransferase [Streptomyces misionensis JCM 4497]
MRTARQPARLPPRGDRGRPAEPAADRHALRLRHAPVRAPAAERPYPVFLLLHRRGGDGQADGGGGTRGHGAARLQRRRGPAGAAGCHHLPATGGRRDTGAADAATAQGRVRAAGGTRTARGVPAPGTGTGRHAESAGGPAVRRGGLSGPSPQGGDLSDERPRPQPRSLPRRAPRRERRPAGFGTLPVSAGP